MKEKSMAMGKGLCVILNLFQDLTNVVMEYKLVAMVCAKWKALCLAGKTLKQVQGDMRGVQGDTTTLVPRHHNKKLTIP